MRPICDSGTAPSAVAIGRLYTRLRSVRSARASRIVTSSDRSPSRKVVATAPPIAACSDCATVSVDRPSARPAEVLNEIFDLFVELDANDRQLDFPVVYASAKEGFAKYELEEENHDLTPLFETIIKHVKEPEGDPDAPLQLLVSAIGFDNFLGKWGTGRIQNGIIHPGDNVLLVKRNDERIPFQVTKVYVYEGLK